MEPHSAQPIQEPAHRSWPMRLWSAAPDWFFRAFGFLFILFVLYANAQKYIEQDLRNIGPFYQHSDGTKVYFFWVPILVDLTLVVVAMSFLVRIPPRNRNTNGTAISISLLAGVWPFFPFALAAILPYFHPELSQTFQQFLWRTDLRWTATITGTALLTVGNALDVWGYLVLCRSFSVVPEARELKTNGPYRWVRHPVYLGQMLAQAGIWLLFAQWHFVWIGFYFVFVAMLLYRSQLEDRVLEEHFGEPYRDWKRRTFWFV